MPKRILTGFIASVLAGMLLVTDVFAAGLPAAANQTPSITLNGTVNEGSAGFLSSKSIIMSSGTETRINYRLVPNYAAGAATNVRVTLFMPSLDLVDGEYQVVSRDAAPTPMGVQGELSSGADWRQISNTTAQGGPLVLEYDGDLRAGANPAFDILLTTYDDGSDGVYGGVPEGTAFEINGLVSYDMFNRVPGSSWETPQQLDDDSRVTAIASDLKWDASVAAYAEESASTSVPMWDRYQYFDYTYDIANVSTNPASRIDGYSVTFDIDTTDNINGIIPFDINRFLSQEDGSVVPNPDPEYMEGEFVGVPGQGGVLIYDVTEWDGTSELTEEIPYTYSGAGMIVINREFGAEKQALAPGQERTFLVKLPMSRQGFPNLPTVFKLKAITNVLFAKNANWSKTNTAEREIVVPTYGLTFSHTPEHPEVLEGAETFTRIDSLKNTSDAPIFEPSLTYGVDEQVEPDRVVYSFDPSLNDALEGARVRYAHTDRAGDRVTDFLTGKFVAGLEGELSTLTFDVTALGDLEWDRTLVFMDLANRIQPGHTLPLSITVVSTGSVAGTIQASAVGRYFERFASNADYAAPTEYTDVERTSEQDASYEIVKPAPQPVLDPGVSIVGISGDRRTENTTEVPYEAPFQAEYRLTTRDVPAGSFTLSLEQDDPKNSPGAASPTRIVLTEALTQAATDLTVTVVDSKGKTERTNESDIRLADLDLDSVAEIIISGKNLTLAQATPVALVEYDSALDMGGSQQLRASLSGTQVPPDEAVRKANASHTVTVAEAKTQVKTEGLNQVEQTPGAGNEYDQWVERQWYCGYSGCGSKIDATLDQGIKSLGGFATTLTRPTAPSRNNDQTTVIDVTFPAEQFDMYYMKIRDTVQDQLRSVDIYRSENGEDVLWKSIDASEWVENTAEGGFWRIATADPGAADLFSSFADTEATGHSYYKAPFASDVVPEQPVSKVTLTLDFSRTSANASPQMPGTSSRVVEYMGRFYETSEEGKKLTSATAVDTIGLRHPIERAHTSAPVYSLVSYPYAQSDTGAQVSTSDEEEYVPMGSEAFYLASVLNVNNGSWYYYNGHGPDVYSPVWTEFDEWLYHYDPASFHDSLIYQFTYPASPKADPNYHFEATRVLLPNDALSQYLTGFRVEFDDGTHAEIAVDEALLKRILDLDAAKVTYDNRQPAGFHVQSDGALIVSSGDPTVYPLTFAASFAEIDGFGDTTTELQGTAADTLGANLREIDVKIGGIVHGNKALQGKTSLIRDPDDSAPTVMHTSVARLIGETPTLGASLDMTFDALTLHDYAEDGITPETSEVRVGIANTAQSDITAHRMSLKLDTRFRSQLVQIPAEVFAGAWRVDAVSLTQAQGAVQVDLDRFTLNEQTQQYELDLAELFADGTLRTTSQRVTFGGAAELLVEQITNLSVDFAATENAQGEPGTRMWGSAARAVDATLPDRMLAASAVVVVGDWVDETVAGNSWESKPTHRAQGTKVDSGSLGYTSFTASAGNLVSSQQFTRSAGGGNTGTAPQYVRDYGTAPIVQPRLSQLQLLGTHLNEDLTVGAGQAANLFDADSSARIAQNNMVVGDTAKVLYELRNSATKGSGYLPIFDPSATFTAPAGLAISGVQAITVGGSAGLDAVIAATGRTPAALAPEQATVSGKNPEKRSDVLFTGVTIAPEESVLILVDYVAVNDFNDQLGATQGKAAFPYAYARPGFQHHIQNYVVSGVTQHGVTGATSSQSDYDADGVAEHLARVYNPYTYSNPSDLRVSARFPEETVSGSSMTLSVQNISNEILHDNTNLTLDITLDTRAKGFQLTELPAPTYPEGYVGEFDQPRVLVRVGNDWVPFSSDTHDLSSLAQLRIDYGLVPARDDSGAERTFPDVELVGAGRWQPTGGAATKSSVITPKAQVLLTHFDGAETGNPAVATYQTSHEHSLTIFKGMPLVELNLQTFDSAAEAEAPYTDASASELGKTSYQPGEEVHVRLTARNANTPAATQTGLGKAPLRDPVLFDKIPEYLEAPLTGVISGGELDVAAAVAQGHLTIRHFAQDGTLRSDVPLPEATVRTEQGLDVGGAQTFANDRLNNAQGILSSQEPVNTTVNPAREVRFQVVTYSFAQELGRGERIEISYPGAIRQDDLPYATYGTGRAVHAPLLGWYGNSDPVASTTHRYDMDMAALLHDAGISGSRGQEMTPAEFLSQSFAWVPGSNRERDNPNVYAAYMETYYDASANSGESHRAYLQERADNRLFEGATSGETDDNFMLANQARVNDGDVRHAERILWAQDNLQLNRAWLYGASEMVPETERQASGVDPANFYEFDGSLKAPANGITPYAHDDSVYAVQLHERFTVRLHAANLGDRAIESGIEYLEVLPVGVTPFDEQGGLLGVDVFDGAGERIPALDSEGNPLPGSRVTVEVVQTPSQDAGIAAPAQHQEAGTYRDTTVEDAVPYVLRVTVDGELTGMFHEDASTLQSKYQRVEIGARVEAESALLADGKFFWYDQLTVTTSAAEEYLEIYDNEYGAFDRAPHVWNPNEFPNDGMAQGVDVLDLSWTNSNETAYLSMEPWGMYLGSINSQGSLTTLDGKPAIVNGDRLAMRAPTLRVWNSMEKDTYDPGFDESIQNFTAELYEEFTLHATVENQQVETASDYFVGAAFTENRWTQQPQTTGGARGSWFDPTVTVALPYGILPVLADGSAARFSGELTEQQDVAFAARISDVTYASTTPVADVTEHFDVAVERETSPHGERFLLHFTLQDTTEAQAAAHQIDFGQSLTVSPRVVVGDQPQFAAGSSEEEQRQYQEILTLANSERPSFAAVVVGAHPTGSAPSGAAADKKRLDSTSEWLEIPNTSQQNNWGVLRVTDRLIAATKPYHQQDEIELHTSGNWTVRADELLPAAVPASGTNVAAYGATRMMLRQPTLVNTTQTGLFRDEAFVETQPVDSAGAFWVSTQIRNRPANHPNPYEMLLDSGIVHNSRFVVSAYVSSFAERTGAPQLVVQGAVLTPQEYEPLGYSVALLTQNEREGSSERQLVQWLVTTPASGNGTRGHLASGESVSLRHQFTLVDGFESGEPRSEPNWQDDSLRVDSYVSVIPDDTSLIAGDQPAEHFIVQDPSLMGYERAVEESLAREDLDRDGEQSSFFAHDAAAIEIIKPRAEVRVNTTRPRLEYSNMLTGDPYFNSSDTIEYLVTHAKNTGSGLKQLVVEHTLPTHESHDDSVSLSVGPMDTTLRYVTSGVWEVPAATQERIAQAGKTLDQVFETEVLISSDIAEEPYAAGKWKSLGTSALGTNTVFTVAEGDRLGQRQVRLVVRSIDQDFLVPQGTRLAVDADPDTAGTQEVTETDPDNRSTAVYPATVTDNAMRIGMSAASERKSTMFIYDTVQLWGNYVSDAMMRVAQQEVRSYLTPSRPVVNVFHKSVYYRTDSAQPQEQRWGWSDNTAVRPETSPHLKFRGEVVNADESMWDQATEGSTYSEDTLIDPTVTFELPTVMTAGNTLTYVPQGQVTPAHPLSDEHRSQYSLTDADAFQWTWKLVRADGSEASADSFLKHTDIQSGPWSGMDRNVVTVWFEGMVYPGDKIVVDFIGKIDSFTPGAGSDEMTSKVYASNSTGLVQPLNSQANRLNRLGYMTDRFDLDGNKLRNDRLVFAERVLFSYETSDNFGKRKLATSDLNEAGTVWPLSTPVREGGAATFSLSLDNMKATAETPYPYPILYDLLPHEGDTSMVNAGIPRESMGSSLLDLDSFRLAVLGETPRVYPASEYTVYVGPFSMEGGQVVPADLPAPSVTSKESFYDSLATPEETSRVRDAHFVTLAEFQQAVAERPELLPEARAVLALFNDRAAQLPGQSKLTLSYEMHAPLNAPAFLETWQPEGKPADVEQWNSFVGTQRKTGFIPQESNKAGTYVTEQAETVSLGNYVWEDANYNGKTDEGETFVDENGRTLLRPTEDIDFDGTVDDPGINGVRVTALTSNGRLVDALGNPIVAQGDTWVVVDDASGEVVLDDIGQTTESDGPLRTTTRADTHGHDGYYVFSNIAPGEYRVMFEFPAAYDRFSVTTEELLSGTSVSVFEPGEATTIPAGSDTDALVAVTAVTELTPETPDATRMGFDLGVGQLLDFGGAIWKDANRDGSKQRDELPLEGFTVALLSDTGKQILDANGEPLSAVSAADGSYQFWMLPRAGGYTVQVTHPGGSYDINQPVSPVVQRENPLANAADNDAFVHRDSDGVRTVITNEFQISVRELYATNFAPQRSVSAGLYDRRDTSVIGNRVWEDRDRDGLQDSGEPGVVGQELMLEQYELRGDRWVKNERFSRTTTSGEDGYYFFTDVPALAPEGAPFSEYRYQVTVAQLAPNYTFAPPRVGEDPQRDSDFFMTGSMHSGTEGVGEHLVALVAQEGDAAVAVDDSTIDLGLIRHATGVIAGEVFIDTDEDGQQSGDRLAAERFTATLQVSTNGVDWADVATQRGVHAYRFTDVPVADDSMKTVNQYRVLVSEIPTWLTLTGQHLGDDASDSDFAEIARAAVVTAVSDTYTLADEAPGHLNPVDSRTARAYEQVDLGLVEPRVTVGGRAWDDRNADGIQDADEGGIAGQQVTLWELVDGAWVESPDLHGVTMATTDADGRFTFAVSPTHYAENHPRFLLPREYRVTSDRAGFQEWSPTLMGEDGNVDSDILPAAEGELPLHRGTSGTFTLADRVPASDDATAQADQADYSAQAEASQASDPSDQIDPATLRDDLSMGLGLVTHAHQTVLGGAVWEDANEDGVQQQSEAVFAERDVQLWEKIDGEWVTAIDENGDAVRTTNAAGRYEFVVSPTHYAETHPGYLLPREFRTTVSLPAGHVLSRGEAVTAALEGQRVVSLPAQLITANEEGSVVLSSVSADTELSFPFALIPAPGGAQPDGGPHTGAGAHAGSGGLAVTGGPWLGGFAALGLALLGAGVFLSRKRREQRLDVQH